MAHSSFPQYITVDVSYYNNAERQELLKYPSAKEIEKIVSEGLMIPTAEFLTYYLYKRKRSGSSTYNDYESISKMIYKSLEDLDGFVVFNRTSICTHEEVHTQREDVSEHIGEAVGLSIVSHLHRLINADWDPIPEHKGRGALNTFDYQIASDGNQFIQVECKGSSVEDNRQLSKNIYSHKSDIKTKKSDILKLEDQEQYPYSASLRYGTITAVDRRRDGNVKCWLVDPQPKDTQYQPRQFRLLARMQFLYEWISFISPRSQFAASLATRIAALKRLRDPFELDGVPLYRADGKSFDKSSHNELGQNHAFFANKSHILDEPSGGIVLQLSDYELFFIGITENLVALASSQNFDSILSFKSDTKSLKKNVECIISKGRFKKFHLAPSISYYRSEKNDYVRFQMTGQIHYNNSGLVFGSLFMENEDK